MSSGISGSSGMMIVKWADKLKGPYKVLHTGKRVENISNKLPEQMHTFRCDSAVCVSVGVACSIYRENFICRVYAFDFAGCLHWNWIPSNGEIVRRQIANKFLYSKSRSTEVVRNGALLVVYTHQCQLKVT